ncbi:lysin [Streptomyces avicenniae]|uniref:lysin n=1 Tax=Streptomyces avicenniae TaxID=500153 RepID=UPI000699F563|nr:lysin [Streptomyces avicenniae]
MRPSTWTRTLVGVTTVVVVTAGGLTGASADSRTSGARSHPAVTAEQAVPLAVVNLGLSNGQARNIQCWLRTYWGYTGALDGQLGPNSWRAFQRNLRANWGYTGLIDGIVGTGTISALQRLLRDYWGYTGGIDGIAGPGTQAAFKRMANGAASFC